MTKTKNLLKILMTIILLALLLPLTYVGAVEDYTPESDFTFNSTTGTITKYIGSGGDVTIPPTIGGVSVTSIGGDAFYGCSSLTRVTLPDSVISIGSYVFSDCSSLTNITIPDNVTSIGDYAFYGCSGLTSVMIPDSVTSIGSGMFYKCTSLTRVTFPDGITSIVARMFESCSSLTSITIPGSVTSIGEYAFSDCIGLTGITIPNSVISIGNDAFYKCTGMTGVTLPNGIASIGKYVFAYCSSLTGVTIPDSVTSIGGEAFFRCSSLARITIPDSVTSIAEYAFYNCTSLTSVTIPESVISIGDRAFYSCDSMTKINVEANNPNYVSIDGVLCSKGKTEIVQYPSGKGGYYDVPNSITSIGELCFSTCLGLTSVSLSDSVTSIGTYAFFGCSDLTSVTISDKVTSIGEYAFNYCTSLAGITIPDGVTSIGNFAFADCSNLKKIIVLSTKLTTVGVSAFGYLPSDVKLYVPDETVKTLLSGKGIADENIIVMDNDFTVTSIELPEIPTVQGKTITAPINIKDNSGLATFEFVITYDPDVLKVLKVTNGSIWESKLDVVGNPDYKNNQIKIVGASDSNNDGDGSIACIEFEVNQSAEFGPSPITIHVGELKTIGANSEQENIFYITDKGAVTVVLNSTKGDVNGDGKVTASDATDVLMYVVGKKTFTDVQKDAADMFNRGEDKISSADALEILNIAAGLKNTQEASQLSVGALTDDLTSVRLQLGSVAGNPGENVTVPLYIPVGGTFNAFEFVIDYDSSALTPVGFEDCDSWNGLIVENITYTPDSIIIAGISTSGVAAEGVFANITFKIKEDAKYGVSDIKLRVDEFKYTGANYVIADMPCTPNDGGVVALTPEGSVSIANSGELSKVLAAAQSGTGGLKEIFINESMDLTDAITVPDGVTLIIGDNSVVNGTLNIEGSIIINSPVTVTGRMIIGRK